MKLSANVLNLDKAKIASSGEGIHTHLFSQGQTINVKFCFISYSEIINSRQYLMSDLMYMKLIIIYLIDISN